MTLSTLSSSVTTSTSWLSSSSSLLSSGATVPLLSSQLPTGRGGAGDFSRTMSTSSTSYKPSPLDAFRDSVDRETRGSQPVGRSWSVSELRRKSYEDLHKLWYVLYTERNMLLTEQQLSRRRQLRFPQPQRIMKVQKSMQGIKQVLGERKRQKILNYQTSKLAEGMLQESDVEEIEVVVSEK